MHIKSVTAEAFGPLANETLTLSPGLTIVHGDNESAKSSWHAAIYAALCGRRRGKGANKLEDREFADRRRPWDRNSWKVRCDVRLDDGRTVTLRHDLDGKVDCCAVDERGRDVSGEIMYDGAPDGSRWLGLNRRTFAATACVNQAELLRVLDAAGDLQTDIQRAAATAGKDETAAAALAALKKYASDHVGLERRNSRRPLQRALDDHEWAFAAYEQAQRAHDDYLRLVIDAESAHEAAAAAAAERVAAEAAYDAAERLLHAARKVASARVAAAHAQALADEKRARATVSLDRSTRARVLSAAAPDAEPAGNNDDALAQQVARALGSWDSAPSIPSLAGRSSRQLQADIEAAPVAPAGDLAVDPTVERLREHYLQAAAVVERDERNRVSPPDVSDPALAAAVEVDPSALRWLTERLAEPVAAVDSRLRSDVDAARQHRDQAATAVRAAELQESAALTAARQGGAADHASVSPLRLAAVAIVAGAVLAAAAVALIASGQPVGGVVLAVVAVGTVAVGALVRRPAHRSGTTSVTSSETLDQQLEAARERLRTCRDTSALAERALLDAQARLDAAGTAASSAAARRQAAATEAANLGLPTDQAQLRALVAVVQRVCSQREAFERWHCEHDADVRALKSSTQRLVQALRDRGYDGHADVREAYAAYERECATRAEQARQAQRREELAARLRDRLASEGAAERAKQARDDAVGELLRLAHLIARPDAPLTLTDADDDADNGAHTDAQADDTHAAAEAIAGRLRRWLHDRSAALEVVEVQRRRWEELQALLDGHTLDDLQAVAAADAEAAEAAEEQSKAATEHLDSATDALQAAATAAAAGYPIEEEAARALFTSCRQRLGRARDREAELSREASSQQGKVVERERAIPSVAEAEEALDRSRRELDRVRSLGRVLDLTASFLEQAQETTYNNLAPVLSSALERWLPEITGGRYRRARVDPETLAVRVESETGALRLAELLSVGTAEQVYLLLRVALAEHLATASTVSPLLLDDVTVQADPTRTEAILRMCKALADDGRQVVLFAQEQSVAAWAERNLDGTEHSLVRLSVSAAA